MATLRALVLASLALLSPTAIGQSSPSSAPSSKDLWHDQKPGSSLVPEIARGFPSLAPLVRQIKPAVVNIATTQRMRRPGAYGYGQSPFDQFFQQYFGGQAPPQRQAERRSLGSGFIIDERGYVLTNNHVIEGADEIKVTLADGREFSGKVVGADPKTDVALVKLLGTDSGFPFLLLGDSDQLEVGDWVVAIGDPFGLELSVTHGMVSAKARSLGAGPYDDFIQSDALINPGNSGGPLFSMGGAVIGINTAITTRGQGIGFAVPINMAKQLLPQLLSGHISRGYLGVGVQALTPDLARSLGLPGPNGALIAKVLPGQPGDKGGMHEGDVVVSVNGGTIHTAGELTRAVASVRPGNRVTLGILREGTAKTLKVKVGERPDELGQGDRGELGEEDEGGAAGTPAVEEPPRRDSLGLSVRRLPPEVASQQGSKAGVQILDVEPDGAAAEAGLQPGDIVVEVNRRIVHSVPEYRQALGTTRSGELALLRVERQHEPIFFAVKAK
jgi:serine protease Do